MRKDKQKTMYRSWVQAEEFTWLPHFGLCPNWDVQRNLAIMEVARRLPEDAVQGLEEKSDSFSWFIPLFFDDDVLAGVYPFPATYDEPGTVPLARVLYLSPLLERMSSDIIIACIVHELAHIYLRHSLWPRDEVYSQNEKAAWELVDTWGFGWEAKKHELFYKQKKKV